MFMKIGILIAMLFCITVMPSAATEDGSGIEATTAISLPVDSVTIYPDGLVFVRRTGSMDVTEGLHTFVVDVPDSASKDTVLFQATNASVERIVYESMPQYTMSFYSAGTQQFVLSYLMTGSGVWAPNYFLYMQDDSMVVSANAILATDLGEDLKNVRVKLVAGPSRGIIERFDSAESRGLPEELDFLAEAAPAAAPSYMPTTSGMETGEMESLFVFVLDNRTDIESEKPIGLPIFEETVPIERLYTWDAYNSNDGPVKEEVRANNTLDHPWPSGSAGIYREGEYVTTVEFPYTAKGANASLTLGTSADLKVSRKLKDYNITERIVTVDLDANNTRSYKETTENWTYQLELKSSTDKEIDVEVTDSKPKEAEVINITLDPTEITATGFKWIVQVLPHKEVKFLYTYRLVKTESLDYYY